MNPALDLAVGVSILIVGTYLIRLAGPALRSRLTVSPITERILDRAAITLLVGVALTGALFVGDDLSGWARPAGVSVGVIAALAKAPLAVVVILAAATAAGLRALGVA
ncbi:AzlD domain-containing protein [Gordonia sp. ABSL1-1]|uniref:AzlD domain-containing protein n=1 Tax=Gordonia sp. ABSL1-1 TaxID=3053923 RepID=UPI0025722DBA|nr:AzlD domain-containing protein [Gordonia sp. ABSL1-1]MDL9938272.1 AzlD domain-containing protein [Gordonia sp. ABSL1-1]